MRVTSVRASAASSRRNRPHKRGQAGCHDCLYEHEVPATTVIAARVTTPTAAALKVVADTYGITRSAFIAKVISDQLDRIDDLAVSDGNPGVGRGQSRNDHDTDRTGRKFLPPKFTTPREGRRRELA